MEKSFSAMRINMRGSSTNGGIMIVGDIRCNEVATSVNVGSNYGTIRVYRGTIMLLIGET